MSRNLQTLVKWFPGEIVGYENIFKECGELEITCLNLVKRLAVFINNLRNNKNCQVTCPILNHNETQITDLEDIGLTIEIIVECFNNLFPKLNDDKLHVTISNKLKMWKRQLWLVKLKLTYFAQDIINEIAYFYIYYGENYLLLTLRISLSYNNLLGMDKKYFNGDGISICNNTCPYLMFPSRKMSVTRLLQIIACNRAEMCCHKLIDCLLETYKIYESADDDNGSDNSSLEIYMTLTKHMSPQARAVDVEIKQEVIETIGDSTNFSNLEELISGEEKNVLDLLTVVLKISPTLLGNDGVKKSRNSGITKISTKAQTKVLEYYEQILWGEVGNYLEHIVLWWAPCPLSARPPQSSQHLREWINQFTPTADIPSVVLSALTCLADALGVHVSSTSWDEKFRLALVASKTTCNPETGKLFSNVLHDLVMLSNQCEVTPDWIVGAPLDELPLVEQIPVLHRLDHSVHTTRLWAANETKKLANNWNMKAFFAVTHGDIVQSLTQLGHLRMTDHTLEIEKKGLGVHVEVCTLMRAKLTSEVNVNIDKLKNTPKECVEGLASVCRTICLANLKMIFPTGSYWKQSGSVVPENASHYVHKYLNQILIPVLEATDDTIICNMILTLICESWLDHIYTNKIKFSQHGACQLLCDFSYVKTWLVDCTIVKEPLRRKLLKNEILKRCEGVGRLLLRRPGERIKMADKNDKRVSSSDSEGEKTELMPAEMYVPNQEQWLELRASQKKGLFAPPLCCGKP